MQIIGILGFIAALLLSVMIHEFGHYLTAKRYGMKVSEFFLGFGSRIWSTKRGETEFGLKAIPAGGYCKIEGMTPNDVMPEGEESRAFYTAKSSQKLIVLGAGSFLHFVLGYILLFVLFAGVGTNQLLPTINQVVKGSAAQSVGILAGDEVLAINGKQIDNWYKDVQIIRNSKGAPLTLLIKRGTEEITISASAKLETIDGTERYVLGIINDVGIKRSDLATAAKNSAIITKDFLVQSVKSLIKLPSKIPALWGQAVSGETRDPNGLVGVVGVARVSGQAVGSDALSITERLSTFILIIASLNIFVGLFNLLPILPLDGGHMAVAIADEIRAFIARLRGRARPAAIDVTLLTPITMVVFVILAALTVLLLIADIVNPVILNL
ncbi:putative zinc metalloprotease [Actinomycetes bacterium]|nr:putative zinc metalloprotease SCO5695 [Actinomycetota bacterium]GDX20931.1 putative zinc metalloprotease [Actinomycetes bacterium]